MIPVYFSNHYILMFPGKNFVEWFVPRNKWLKSKITILERAAKIVFGLINPRVCGLNNENVHLIVLLYLIYFLLQKKLT